MRNLAAGVLITVTAFIAGPVVAADLPIYPPPPPVDNGLGGAFYLRASLGANLLWTGDHVMTTGATNTPTAAGYGYSFGVGLGYEVGNGLRADVTVDQIHNTGLTDGIDQLELRSTIALANAYYDFPIGDFGSGGLGAYVGAGIGGADYQTHVTDNATGATTVGVPDGSGWTAAGAAMAGVTYDMGAAVADLGYRLIYMPQIGNNAVGPTPAYYINNNFVHEVRGTLRYRFY
jgi:opacity protein-like surface antigen